MLTPGCGAPPLVKRASFKILGPSLVAPAVTPSAGEGALLCLQDKHYLCYGKLLHSPGGAVVLVGKENIPYDQTGLS